LRFCRTDDRFANTWRSKGGCSWITFPSPRRVPPQLLHVSLYNVEQSARISDAVIFAACRTASAIDACQFELSFDHVATFRKSRRNAIVLSGNGGRSCCGSYMCRWAISEKTPE